ncbi:MAG: bifunctional glutamate N-acetyltransferase/amino-acid acetyltransferase ArgJ [Candidatus Altiarchaeota archaeon]|nr:bifunctional glutamate N-acetyltransferase/amino-acid acetyltransferase ArgJ [Candidatus Altiarchaeota archaeon]
MEIRKTGSGICVDGFQAAGAREGKYGVALIMGENPCEAAGAYTRNSLKAAPVIVTAGKIDRGRLQAVIANSGNANACVKEGMQDAEKMCGIAGGLLGVTPDRIGVASTGIIGRRLDLESIEKLAGKAASNLSNSFEGGLDAAKAIMTTDTIPKQLSFEYKGIEIGGICKGSGMIAPDMATMLCFLATNAKLPAEELRECLKEAVDESFNMLVIDGDMSTNDMVLLLSSGKTECIIEDFQALLNHATKEFAKLMAFDGEGATKFLEVKVRGASDKESAKAAAKAIVASSLVKCAMNGENPNWGRIAAAMGSVMEYEPLKMSIAFGSGKGETTVYEKGEAKDLAKAREILKDREINVTVDLDSGKSEAVSWGCDLTKEYVRINAEYN